MYINIYILYKKITCDDFAEGLSQRPFNEIYSRQRVLLVHYLDGYRRCVCALYKMRLENAMLCIYNVFFFYLFIYATYKYILYHEVSVPHQLIVAFDLIDYILCRTFFLTFTKHLRARFASIL